MQNSGLAPCKRVSIAQYDFATDGGAIGAITVPCHGIPAGAIITSGMVYVDTAPVGVGASVAIHVLTAEDLLAATAITSLTLAAMLDIVPVGTAATAILATANITQVTFTISAAALTAGKITVQLEFLDQSS